jgi:hypothetical protein
METNILKQILFRDGHWDAFVKQYKSKIRPVVFKEVEKYRGCGDPKNGFKLWVCEGRYIRRPAIALHRIKEYDGQYVVFSYHDKADEQEKTERVTVEEFISRLIRHIPEEGFKTIRHYGVYARRIKGVCKKVVAIWQKQARKWIVKAKRMLKRRSWVRRKFRWAW